MTARARFASRDTAPGTALEIDPYGSNRWRPAVMVGPAKGNTAKIVVKDASGAEWRIHCGLTRLAQVTP